MQAFAALAIALLGVGVNLYVPIRGPFGLDFALGSALAYFYLQFDRNGFWPFIVAGIIAVSTWALWSHPYSSLVSMAEFVFVATMLRRLNPLATLTLFWMALGPVIMALFYGEYLRFPREMWFMVYIKQAMNGILCVSLGTFLATFIRLTFSGYHFLRPISVMGFATSGVLPFVLIPTLLLTFENARQEGETKLALHAVAWTQFTETVGRDVAPEDQALSATDMDRALQRVRAIRPDFDDFAPLRFEAIDREGRSTSACNPTCPSMPGVDDRGGAILALPSMPNAVLFLPERGSLIQQWRDGSFTISLPAESGHSKLRATTSLKAMVDKSFMDLRRDFFLLIAAVALIMAVGGILYNRVLSPFVEMQAAIDSWQAYDFSVPVLPPQKFIEIDRFRLLLQQVSESLSGERDRSMELQARLNVIGTQSPMIFAAWLVERRLGEPALQYISARPEERLQVGSELFSHPFKALHRLHPEDRSALRLMLTDLGREGHVGTELRLMGTDGEWRWILLRLSSHRTANDMLEVIGVFTDITELNSMRELLGQTSGIRMIGRMVAGLAHELNQPLNVISMAADNLSHYVATNAAELGGRDRYLQEKTEKIIHQVRRAGTLLRTVEGIANQDPRLEEKHDVAELLGSSLEAVRPFASSRQVKLEYQPSDEAVAVRGNKQALIDSFSAVLRNAVEAAHAHRVNSGDGHVTIHVSRFSNISRVKLEFSDNGPGIDPEIMPYLFSPFMSIKGTAQGAGLSLAKLFSLVQACGGEVYARNNRVGATVTVYLPIA
ncbi:PAS domain-containing sensor histidine kinase [Sphingomonas lacunae]|uniref:histidine kinase n=1 Tax=Sphingomonas lacunae TaxID=2698828 RepID=A0A6M4AQS6_9SPHN|nr:PAS domain-containing sensor histidine kinase [Sphingomonas lacunae]QJQ31056.1 PAS domain-containing sensor histidine kinase [Sphingomonas lacunae]